MNQLYALIAIITALGLAFWRYDYVNDDRVRLQEELSSANGIITTERENAQDAANRALANSIEEVKIEEEYNRMRDCIDNKSCGVVVRWKSCPPVSGSAADKSSTTETVAELERQFQQDANYHKFVIRQWEQRVKALEADLIARSAHGACQPKP
jgi:hypothetical protein